jgi:hypothetical protein
MFQFGSGNVWINPIGGNEASNPTPQKLLTLQDLSLDITQELVEQRGQYKFPDDVAPGDMKVTGKVSTGRWDVELLNQVFFGDTFSANAKEVVNNEAHSIPSPSGPYTITVTNSATFGTDLGVLYAGAPPAGNVQKLVRVTASPATGQYSVSAGVYTFAAADAGIQVLISYEFLPATAGSAFTAQVNNQLMGFGPVSEVYFQFSYQSSPSTATPASAYSIIHLTSVRFSKANMPIKRKGYLNTELDFEAYANASGLIAEFTNPGIA